MQYKLNNGKTIRIPDDTIKKYQKAFDMNENEAINMYLEEEGILENSEIDELTAKAKETKADKLYVSTENKKKSHVKKGAKDDPTKQGLISDLAEFLTDCGYTNVKIENVGKLITFSIGNDSFKLDLIRQRNKTNKKN